MQVSSGAGDDNLAKGNILFIGMDQRLPGRFMPLLFLACLSYSLSTKLKVPSYISFQGLKQIQAFGLILILKVNQGALQGGQPLQAFPLQNANTVSQTALA